MKPRTRAVHAGAENPGTGRPVSAAPSLEQASAPLFRSLADIEAAYEEGAFVYRRYGAANAVALERAIAELEAPAGGAHAITTASGMAAILLASLALTRDRRVIVGDVGLYGGTSALLADVLPSMGIETSTVDVRDTATLVEAIAGAGILIVETISNPAMRVADIGRLAELAHAGGARLVVDNTFASPVLCRPLELGADIVVESTTKYISGHGDALGGALAGAPELVAGTRRLLTAMGPSAGPLDT